MRAHVAAALLLAAWGAQAAPRITPPPGTASVPDATDAVTGGVRLTGDLGGTATSPAVVDDSHNHTTTTVGTLDAGDITTGTLAGARGGVGGALPTCGGTDKLTANGTTVSCATDQTSAGGGYATVQDETTPLTQRTTLNFTGAGVSCADDTTRTTCTIAGGGAPGGSTTQVQYNNASAFGGMARVTTDGNDLIQTGVTAHPAAPAAGFLKQYAFQHHGSTGPGLVQFVDGNAQMEQHVFPFTASFDYRWGCVTPAGYGSATITATGFGMSAGTGTAAAVSWASTNERTRHAWVQYPSGAAVNTNAGLRANSDQMWRGAGAGQGGFYVWGAMNIVSAVATQRVFMGIKDATAVLTATADPNAALDTAYFGCNAADSNLSVCSNDGTTTATCTPLGANFPCHTANIAYDWAFWAAPNASGINYYIRRQVTGQEASGTLSSDLPRTSVALGWDMTINTGSTASAVTMQFGGVCYIANP